MSDKDVLFMKRAFELAMLGRGKVAPNPLVGCVIVKNEKIIGEGFHQAYGAAHAEVNAIKNATTEIAGATVYVTLEPCAHYGKTPPCADLLIAKKVARVVMASQDPFEAVNGAGIKRLKAAGIQVEIGCMQEEGHHVNRRFFTSTSKNRPYIILKWAQTQDHFVARTDFNSKWISNPLSRQLVHKWRSEEMGILVGYNTAKHDNPRLTTRDWQGSNPTRIVIDPRNELNEALHLFDGTQKTLVFTQFPKKSRKNITYHTLNSADPITAILDQLHQLNIQSILVEGGTHTIEKFLSLKLWDEARIFTSPQKFSRGIQAPKMVALPHQSTQISNDTLTTYYNEHN